VRLGCFTAGPEATVEPGASEFTVSGGPQLAFYAFGKRPADWRSAPDADIKAELRQMFGGFASPVPEIIDAVDLVGEACA
jgi:hypothetical protein